MDEKLPETFDVVILGTGLSESILSAALSRHGCSVLHLDRNGYYGSGEAVLPLQSLLDLESGQPTTHSSENTDSKTGVIKFSNSSSVISNVTKRTYSISDADNASYLKLKDSESRLLNLKQKAAADIQPIPSSEATNKQPQETPATSISASTKPDDSEIPDNGGDLNGSNPVANTATSSSTCKKNENQGDELTGKDVSSGMESGAPEAVSDETRTVLEENSTDLSSQLEALRLEIKDAESRLQPTIKFYLDIIGERDQNMQQEGTIVEKFKYLLEKNTAFCLDLTPKLLYSKSEMVDLLISSDVARYCEFKSVSKILSYKDGQLQVVPCSRSDIFSTKFLTMIEKRLLMKTLTICMEKEKNQQLFEEYADKPFIDFLKSQKLTDNLIHYVLSSIAMCTASCPTKQALEKITRFVHSVGRYGSTPFLWPLYGGEMNQAFCRMSAVFGGVYVLNQTITEAKISEDTNKVESVMTSGGQLITCKWLIWNIGDYSTQEDLDCSKISRAIVITDQSIYESDKEEILFMTLPHEVSEAEPIKVLELGPGSCSCPHNRGNLRVLHLTCKSVRQSAEEDLKPALHKLIPKDTDSEKKTPRIFLSVFWNQCDYKPYMKIDNENNTMQFHGPDSGIDPDSAVTQARLAFERICPGAEFLPRPPNPEDIIYCDDAEKSASNQENFQPATDQSEDNMTNEPAADEHPSQSGDKVLTKPMTDEPTDQGETEHKKVTMEKELESKSVDKIDS